MKLHLVSLKGNAVFSNVFWEFILTLFGFGQSVSTNGRGCVPVLLKVCREASGTEAYWPLGGDWP